MEISLNKIMWREAATGGLYLGLAIVATQFGDYYLRNSEVALPLSVIQIAAIVLVSLSFARRVSKVCGDEGFSFGRCFGFLMRLMLFAGIITGLGQSVIFNLADTAYFDKAIESAIRVSGAQSQEMKAMIPMMKKPIIMALGGVLSMFFMGGISSLFISLALNRPGRKNLQE